jgi:transposase-like protein
LTTNQPKIDIQQQAIHAYLEQGIGSRTLANKYGVSRTTINKWVMIHQGIHNLPPTGKQITHCHFLFNRISSAKVCPSL